MKTSTIATILLLGTAQPLFAQSAAPPTEPGLDEIIVTATRRTESSQNVTTALTAFTAEKLAASGINNTVDLQTRTPNLVFSTNGSFGQPYIRGIGSDQITPGFDAPVATYIDGAYQARPTSSVVDFFDVSQVEVLKGPQGALYGRNATGGAINILTEQPRSTLGADAHVQYGNYDRVQVRGAVNVPLGDKVAIRVAGIYTSHEGYTLNLFDGRHLDGEDAWGLRGSIRLQPTDAVTLTLSAEKIHEDSTRNNANKIIVEPGLPNPFLTYPVPESIVPSDPRKIYNDFRPRILLNQTRFNGRLDWELGFANLQSTTAYTKIDNVGDFDLDGTATAFAYDRETDGSRSFTQNVQLSSVGNSRFQWIVGADYFHEKATQNFDARLLSFLFPAGTPQIGPGSPITGIVWNSALRSNAWSVFADARYDLTDRLRLVASARYNHDRKNADFSQTLIDPLGILGVGATIVIPASPRLSKGSFTPRFGIEYRPRANALLYATVTNGFKSGGFNLLNQGESFGPEKVRSYEAGIKADWLDRKLRTNFSGFYYDYKDLQVLRYSGLSNVVGNADARIYGAELEVVARPVRRLSLDANIAYLHARYTDYVTQDSNNLAAGVVNLRGNIMPRSPSWTFMAGADYTLPIGASSITARAEMRRVSRIYFDQFETAALTQGPYTTVNARLAFHAPEDRWSVALWGRNLTDKQYIQSMVRVDQFFGTIANYGAPRTYGIELSARY